MNEQTKPRCAKRVYGGSCFTGHQCERTGTLEHKGKAYCKQHFPPNVEAKITERNQRWDEEYAAKKKAHEDARSRQAELSRKAAAYERLEAFLDPDTCTWDDGTIRIEQIRAVLKGEESA